MDTKSSTNLNHKKDKDNYIKVHHSQITSDKEKILNKTRGGKVILYMEKQKIRKTTGFS